MIMLLTWTTLNSKLDCKYKHSLVQLSVIGLFMAIADYIKNDIFRYNNPLVVFAYSSLLFTKVTEK